METRGVMKRLKTATAVLACALCMCLTATVMQSCSEEDDCSANARNMLNATVCRTVVTDEQERLTATDTIPQLYVTALGTDSVIINDEKNVTTLSLPLRFYEGSTTMVLSYVLSAADTLQTPGSKDTITFSHDNTVYFLSMDCNYAVRQKLTGISYTTHQIDSIVVTNATANSDGTENIKIYPKHS